MDYTDILSNDIYALSAYVIEFTINLIFWIAIFKGIKNAIKRKNNHKYFKNNIINNKLDNNVVNALDKKRTYEDVSKTALAKFNTDDINLLKDYFYNMFLDFEKAYNNLDYNTMKLLSTKQMYHNYYTGISLDLKVGRKRIINDIKKKKVIIFELDSTIAKQIASAMIEIEYVNYTIDKNGKVISGSRNKTAEKFEVMFRKDFERKDVIECPNCGANVVGNKCEYCRSNIKNVDFKISSIKKIIE